MKNIIIVWFLAAMISAPSIIPARVIRITSEEIEKANDPIETIKLVAKENGIREIDMLAISHQESLLGKLRVGDKGCSLGYFHINTCVHEVPGVIGNVRSEAEWVADKLNGYGYPDDSRKAIAMYNSPANPNWDYADKVESRKRYVEQYIKANEDEGEKN